MDDIPPQDAYQSKDEKRHIRRVQSPSRQREWTSNSYRSKSAGGRFSRPRDDCSFHKPGFGSQRYHHFHPRAYFHRRYHFQPKLQHIALRKRAREQEKERYEERESPDGNTARAFLPRSTSSRDKDMQFIVGQSDRKQSIKRDHQGTKSKERGRSRDRELPSTASQTVAQDTSIQQRRRDMYEAEECHYRGTKSLERERSRDGELPSAESQTEARDRAIQQKRREIDEVYHQESEMFGLVAKMLIAKDQSLERPIQSSLQENLRDIGKRCVEAMEKFIEDYDSRELSC
ncbi:periphilin-1 [Chaetodon trifascialis]|uniref:periphilin-1 n=1 Tax=Chaetodon trifascialis TaxID=109706 RepID=UPI0039937927